MVTFLSLDERVILFKSPASDAYAQALLTAIGLPPLSRLKLTTYRSIWIPHEISEHPDRLNGKKALLVCANVDGETLRGLYPLREVTIVRSRMLGEQLELVIETGGFVKCSDYGKYLSDLEQSQLTLPPHLHSYIAFDRLRDLTVVSIDNIGESIRAWQKLAETLAGANGLQRAGFFCITQITQVKDGKILNPQIPEKDDLEPTSCSHLLDENSKYTIKLLSSFPRHTERDGLSLLNLDIKYPKWVIGQESVEIYGYSQEYSIPFHTKTENRESFPTSIIIRPSEPAQSKAPKLELPVQLKRSRSVVIKQIGRIGLMLIGVALIASLYFYGQLMQSLKAYPDLQTIITSSPETIGAILSTITLTVLTALFSRILAKER